MKFDKNQISFLLYRLFLYFDSSNLIFFEFLYCVIRIKFAIYFTNSSNEIFLMFKLYISLVFKILNQN